MNTFLRVARWPGLLALVLTVTVCSDATGPDPILPDPVPARLALDGAVPAAAGAGNEIPVAVLVFDEDDAPLADVAVMFELLDGGTLSAESLDTDSAGRASITWTLPVASGVKRLRVRSDTLELSVSVDARMGVMADLQFVSLPPVEAPLGATVGPVIVRAIDAGGAPAPGAQIGWDVVSGGGLLVSPQAYSGLDGTASTSWRLGTSGEQRLRITIMIDGATMTMTFTTTLFTGIRIEGELPARARIGVSYAARVQALGGTGPYTLSLATGALPPGLTLRQDSIVGVPEQTGTWQFGLRLTDALGASATRAYALRVCPGALSLAEGGSVIIDAPGDCGLLLPAADGHTYRVGVMARGGHLAGAEQVTGGLLVRALPEGGAPIEPLRVTSGLGQPAPAGAPAFSSDVAILERDAREFVHAAGAMRVSPAQAASTAGEPAPTRSFRVRVGLGANDVVLVNATLRRLSASVAYYLDDEAVANGGNDYTDERLDGELAVFDQYGRTVLDDVFGGWAPPGTTTSFTDDQGNVLELPTTDLDLNGRIVALQLRPQLMSGYSGWVTACDRLPRPEHANGDAPTCGDSNEGEIMYVLGPGRSLLVHEAKHITSHGYAIFGGRGFNPSWIEEGTAFNASEKVSRAVSGMTPDTRVRAADIFVNGGIESENTQNMRAATALARVFLAAAPIASIAGNPVPNPGQQHYYGSSWFFHRFLEDAYGDGTGVQPYLRMNSELAGLEGIEAATGRTVQQLLAEFMLAIAVEDVPAARAATARVFTGYDFADITDAEYDPSMQYGAWPVLEADEAYGAREWSLDAWYTAPVFFQLRSEGALPLNVEVLNGDGAPLDPEHAVVVVVVRTS